MNKDSEQPKPIADLTTASLEELMTEIHRRLNAFVLAGDGAPGEGNKIIIRHGGSALIRLGLIDLLVANTRQGILEEMHRQ